LITEKTAPERPPTGRAVTQRKLRVDETHRLDLAQLRRDGFLAAPPGSIWGWRVRLGLRESVAYGFLVPEGDSVGGMALFDFTDGPGSELRSGYLVLLETKRPNFGGRRLWFRCPIVIDRTPCNRRCRILYRPSGQLYFGCRECWGLSYESRQRHRHQHYENYEKPWRALEALHDAFATGRPSKRLWRALQRWDRLAPRLEAALAADEEGAG
jgi:hypothetical protein